MKPNQSSNPRSGLRLPTTVKSKISPPTQIGATSPLKQQVKDIQVNNPSLQPPALGPKQRSNTVISPSNAQKPVSILQQSPPYQSVSIFLHKVIGMSSQTNENFAILSENLVAYLAQNIIVIYDVCKNEQLLHFHNQNNKAYRVLKYFPQQSMIISGEGNTKQGEIHIFSINLKPNLQLVHKISLKGHKYGIRNFDLQGSLLISIGDENDKGMLAWDLRNYLIISANLQKKSIIQSLSFIAPEQENKSEYIYITCGTAGHLKLWKIKANEQEFSINPGKVKEEQKIPKQKGMKIQLNESNQGEIEYQRIVDSKDGIFVLAHRSHQRKIIKLEKRTFTWVNEILLEQGRDYNFSKYSPTSMVVGCQNGIIKVFDTHTCKFNSEVDLSWTKPPVKDSFQIISKENYEYLKGNQQQLKQGKYANVVSVKVEEGILTQIFDDGMITVHSLDQKQLVRLLYSHCDSIHDLVIKEYNSWEENITFATGSKDNSIRIWNTQLKSDQKQQMNQIEGDLKRIQLINEEMKQDGKIRDEEDRGIKSLAYNQMRTQLAVGDMQGNIRIYQLHSENNQLIQEINVIEAHEGKVIALAYSEPFCVSNTDDYVQFLISISSDRVIHIFNALNDEYELLQTIDAATSSLVDVKFIKCTIGVKSKNKVVSQEKQLRFYVCAADKSIYSFKYSPQESKFLPLPKDINKNKINAIALTNQLLIMAKDQGLIEVKQLETMKTTQQTQNVLQNQSQNKNMLEYLRMDLSYDEQLIAVCDKEKSIQIREVRAVEKQLSKIFISDNLSSLNFSSDNKYLLCSSLNPKENGGGIIYILSVEHSQDVIKQKNKQQQLMRNVDGLLLVDANELQEKMAFQTMKSSQLIPDMQEKPPEIEDSKNDDEVREFKVNTELFNTWAKSTNVKESEQKEEIKFQHSTKQQSYSQSNIIQTVGNGGFQTSPRSGPNKQEIAKQHQQVKGLENELEDVEGFIDDLMDMNNKMDEEENLLDNDIDLVIDDIAPKERSRAADENKRESIPHLGLRNSHTQKFFNQPLDSDRRKSDTKSKQKVEEQKISKVETTSLKVPNIADEKYNNNLIQEFQELQKSISGKYQKLIAVEQMSESEKQQILLSSNQMIQSLVELQAKVLRR